MAINLSEHITCTLVGFAAVQSYTLNQACKILGMNANEFTVASLIRLTVGHHQGNHLW